MNEFCSFPLQCPYRYGCARNLNNLNGPLPAVRIFRVYTAKEDDTCPGFLLFMKLEPNDSTSAKSSR